ncbi:hypothetical protein [Agrobacterium sp. YIC 4121]|uniref:hypothetical protein n=1 Tax=Agrobacterium sp. YIC 4121 TaxID=1923829 RepID=UPI00098FC1E9|nr:hypothetical protein [Agrobacterium sp. YIC 4121]OOO25660.1 hypothetical protein BTE54_23945 [Agrobacterium sp. YIC 4121]
MILDDDFERNVEAELARTAEWNRETLEAEITRLRQLLSEAEKREREARAKALEEAAQVAMDWKCSLRPGNIQRLYGHQDAARDIAAKISALQSEER